MLARVEDLEGATKHIKGRDLVLHQQQQSGNDLEHAVDRLEIGLGNSVGYRMSRMIVLGCIWWPMMKREVKVIVGRNTTTISSLEIVACDVILTVAFISTERL